MASVYEYYKDLCNCPGTSSSSAGDGGNIYDFYHGYCICDGEIAYLGMRDLDGNEVSNYGVDVYNVNEVLIGYAATKEEYIAVWNSDPDNQAVGRLINGAGPFGFKLLLNDGQISPPYVIGVPDAIDAGIYGIEYGTEYE